MRAAAIGAADPAAVRLERGERVSLAYRMPQPLDVSVLGHTEKMPL